jgi:hypothetical protein
MTSNTNITNIPTSLSTPTTDTFVTDLHRVFTAYDADHFKYMDNRPELTEKIQSDLVEWIITIHLELKLEPETLYQTISVIDMYLRHKEVKKDKLKVIGCLILGIVAQHIEEYRMDYDKVVSICGDAYTDFHILIKSIDNEMAVCFDTTSSYEFLVQYLKVSYANTETARLACFALESTLQSYQLTDFSPSLLASASLYLARNGSWDSRLIDYTGFDCDKVEFVAYLIKTRLERPGNLEVVKSKYKLVEHGGFELDVFSDTRRTLTQTVNDEFVNGLYSRFHRRGMSSTSCYGYMEHQPHLNHKMRDILVEWLIEVHEKFAELEPETLHQTVIILDRYLKYSIGVPRSELQLVGITALRLAAIRCQSIDVPLRNCVYVCDKAYTQSNIKKMVAVIQSHIGCGRDMTSAYEFLVQYLKVSYADKHTAQLACFALESTLQSYELLSVSPSLIAASSLYLAIDCLWDQRLFNYTGFTEDEVRITSNLIKSRFDDPNVNLKVVKKKYRNVVTDGFVKWTKAPHPIVIRTNKQFDMLWHPETGLVFKSNPDRAVVSRIIDGVMCELTSEDIETCKTMKLMYYA